ncbi:MAG TPA: chorismate mutase, partial [Brevibacterium epidermidis]|nr:chorismate mutase [Brevibacterium epidermidis]
MDENRYDRTRAVEWLQELRGSIDNIDASLVHLLAERFKLTERVGELKADHGLPPA